MTEQERIKALHARMAEIKRAREKRKTMSLSMGCAAAAVCLILLVFGDTGQRGGTAGEYSGATMLFGNAGGYVLVALCAFALGSAVTLLCVRHKRNVPNEITDKEERREPK